VIEELAAAWRGELVSERDYKWRVGKMLYALKGMLDNYKQGDTFFPSIRLLLGLSSQQARHRMRVINNEALIKHRAKEANKEFDRLSWAEMLELIRTPNSGKKRGTKESEGKSTNAPSINVPAGTKLTEINRTGDKDSLTADTISPPPTQRTFPVGCGAGHPLPGRSGQEEDGRAEDQGDCREPLGSGQRLGRCPGGAGRGCPMTPDALAVLNEVLSRLERIERKVSTGVVRECYSVQQAAERLGLSPWTVR
jgi:hypothetical protein